MGKKIIWGAVAVFVLWSILDFIIQGLFLKSAYESTASLWRPMGEMKTGVLYISVFIAALAFSAIYGWLVDRKTLGSGLKYGFLYGIAVGVGMGYGTYSVMPIPYFMALTWFLGSVLEATLGGLLLGIIIRK
jgi:hypothetical protein